MAVRSVIVLALEPDVDHPAWPVWPEYVDNGEKVTFGVCPFPLRVPTLPNKPSLTTYVRTPATRSPDNGMAPAMVGRDLHRDVTVRGHVQPDNAPNDVAQNTIAHATHVARADDQISDAQPDNAQSDADRATDVEKRAAERRMRVKIACLPPGSVDKRMRVGTYYIDDHVAIPQPEDEEEDDDQITPPITPDATQQDALSHDSDAYLMDLGSDDQFYR
jgi:hypothetical protein